MRYSHHGDALSTRSLPVRLLWLMCQPAVAGVVRQALCTRELAYISHAARFTLEDRGRQSLGLGLQARDTGRLAPGLNSSAAD